MPSLPSMAVCEALVFAAIISVYVALASLYAVTITPFNAPDEPAHFNYVRDVSRGHLPVLSEGDWDATLLERLKSIRFPPGSDISRIRYESHQPPLYYLMVAPVAAATAGLGEHAQVRAVRLASVMIGAGALFALYALVAEMFPGIPTIRLLAVGIAALIPMHLAVTASVSNDGLAELLMTLILWQSIALIRRGVTTRRTCALGVLVGFGLLTKLTLGVAIPIVCLALIFAHLRMLPSSNLHNRLLMIGRSWLIAGGCAALLAVPWWIRGASVYGWDDPLGLRRHDQVVAGQPVTGGIDFAVVVRSSETLFRSFWGQFGWMGVVLDDRMYLVFAMLSITLVVGMFSWVMPWGGYRRQADTSARWGTILLIVSFVGVFLGIVGYNLTYIQPQGRYLFPAMGAIATLSAGGIRDVLADRHRIALLILIGLTMIGLDVVILFRIVEPALRY